MPFVPWREHGPIVNFSEIEQVSFRHTKEVSIYSTTTLLHLTAAPGPFCPPDQLVATIATSYSLPSILHSRAPSLSRGPSSKTPSCSTTSTSLPPTLIRLRRFCSRLRAKGW